MDSEGVDVKPEQGKVIVHVAFEANTTGDHLDLLKQWHEEGKIKSNPDVNMSSAVSEAMTHLLKTELDIISPFKVYAVYLNTALADPDGNG